MKKIKVLFFIILITLTATQLTFARRGGRGRGHRHRMGRAFFMIYHHLNDADFLRYTGISNENAEKIKKLIRDARKKIIPVLAKLRVNKLEYQEEMEKKNLNKARLLALAKKMHDNIWEIRKVKIETRVDIAKHLTIEQRNKIQSYLRDRFHRRYRRGRRFHRMD